MSHSLQGTRCHQDQVELGLRHHQPTAAGTRRCQDRGGSAGTETCWGESKVSSEHRLKTIPHQAPTLHHRAQDLFTPRGLFSAKPPSDTQIQLQPMEPKHTAHPDQGQGKGNCTSPCTMALLVLFSSPSCFPPLDLPTHALQITTLGKSKNGFVCSQPEVNLFLFFPFSFLSKA